MINVQIGGGLQPTNAPVENLGKDLANLFGAVGKGVETYNEIGATAAKLEFQSKSLEAQNKITALNQQTVGKENDPEFWMNYNNSIEEITAELTSYSDKFSNHQAAYDVFNNSALDFSSSIRSKYIPYGEEKQFNATKALVVANEDNYLSSIGSNVNNEIIKQSQERLKLVGYDDETAKAWVENKSYSALFNSMDSAIALIPKNEIQNAITLDDGTLNKASAVALFNMTSGNSELTNAIVDKEGNIQIKNTSDDAKIQDDSSKRMQMILSHWAKPTDAGYVNHDYGNLKSSLDTYVINYSNSPSAVIEAYRLRKKARNDFELTAGYKRLTTSEQETYKADANTELAKEQGYRQAVSLYNEGKIGLFANLSQTNMGTFTNLYGKKQEIVISEEMIDAIKKYDVAATTTKVLNGDADPVYENNRIMQLTNSELPAIKLIFSMIDNGLPATSFESAKSNIGLLGKLYEKDTKQLTKSQIQWLNDSNEILAKREKGIYKTDQDAKVALDAATKTASDTARKMNIGLSTEVLKLVSNYSVNKIGADSKYEAGTAAYVAGYIDKLGNRWDVMSDSERYDYISEHIMTTQPSAIERGTTIDTYVVPRLKFEGGGFIQPTTLHDGVDGYINIYNKQHKTNYGTDDFVFEASRNGNIKVSVRGVVKNSELTAEKMQQFAKFKEVMSEKKTPRQIANEKKAEIVKEKISGIKNLVTEPTKTIGKAVKEAEKNIDINLNKLKKGLGF